MFYSVNFIFKDIDACAKHGHVHITFEFLDKNSIINSNKFYALNVKNAKKKVIFGK